VLGFCLGAYTFISTPIKTDDCFQLLQIYYRLLSLSSFREERADLRIYYIQASVKSVGYNFEISQRRASSYPQTKKRSICSNVYNLSYTVKVLFLDIIHRPALI
jgi:hypothetical protein